MCLHKPNVLCSCLASHRSNQPASHRSNQPWPMLLLHLKALRCPQMQALRCPQMRPFRCPAGEISKTRRPQCRHWVVPDKKVLFREPTTPGFICTREDGVGAQDVGAQPAGSPQAGAQALGAPREGKEEGQATGRIGSTGPEGGPIRHIGVPVTGPLLVRMLHLHRCRPIRPFRRQAKPRHQLHRPKHRRPKHRTSGQNRSGMIGSSRS